MIINVPEFSKVSPRRILRPCDYSLLNAVSALEVQLGTVEAYNRICSAAESLKAKIDAGKGKAQNICYSK